MVILTGNSTKSNFASEENRNTFDLSIKSRVENKQANNILLFEDSSKMPSLPQGAFAACKIREQLNNKSKNDKKHVSGSNLMKNHNTQVAKMKFTDIPDPSKYFCDKQAMKYLPVKYNEKFMNAIWGHYNHYSPHNIKSNDTASKNAQ